jgi:exopolysaccharide biosynthesis polyprenyl glycosylphosphotransferase
MAEEKKHLSTGADFLISLSILGDSAMILLGLVLGFWIRFESGWIWFGVEAKGRVLGDYVGLITIGACFLLITFAFLRLYDTRTLLRFRHVAMIIFKGTTFWLFAYLGISLALKFEPPISRIYVLSSFLSALIMLLGWRWIFHKCLSIEAVASRLRQNILFVGWNEEAHRLSAAVATDCSHPYEIIGCVPSPLGGYEIPPPPGTRTLGAYAELPGLIERHAVDIVILSDVEPNKSEIVCLANLCEREFVQFKVIPSYFQILISGLKLETISGVPILGVTELPLDRLSNRAIKRTIDIIGSIIGLVLSAPIIVLCGTLVYIESPGPIFYRQTRTGRNGRNFQIIKLRSMRLDAEATGGAQWAKKNDPRRLRIGSFMREWNLDEVPQFWNVLKGEMSLVGPRPERPELIANFKHEIPHYNARHASKPGITGWAQVNGLRGDTSLVERVRYDLFYLENWSVWLDFQIMIQTFFRRENAY